jgi:uncharacterized membrane protein YfcA
MPKILAVSLMGNLTVALIASLTLWLLLPADISLPAYTTGYIYWPAVAGIAAVSPLGAIVGVKLAHQLPVKLLCRLFAVFMLFVAVEFLFK